MVKLTFPVTTIFSIHKDVRHTLTKLPFSQLKYLCKYFEETHWRNLTKDQIKSFKFEELSEEDLPSIAENFMKYVFHVFDRYQTTSSYRLGDKWYTGLFREQELFQTLQFNQLKFLCEHFDEKHWEALTEDQKLNLNVDLPNQF